MTIKLEISEGLLKEFGIEDESNLREIIRAGIKQMRIEKALRLFEEGKVSITEAAELADVSLREMMFQASAGGPKLTEIDEGEWTDIPKLSDFQKGLYLGIASASAIVAIVVILVVHSLQ